MELDIRHNDFTVWMVTVWMVTVSRDLAGTRPVASPNSPLGVCFRRTNLSSPAH